MLYNRIIQLILWTFERGNYVDYTLTYSMTGREPVYDSAAQEYQDDRRWMVTVAFDAPISPDLYRALMERCTALRGITQLVDSRKVMFTFSVSMQGERLRQQFVQAAGAVLVALNACPSCGNATLIAT